MARVLHVRERHSNRDEKCKIEESMVSSLYIRRNRRRSLRRWWREMHVNKRDIPVADRILLSISWKPYGDKDDDDNYGGNDLEILHDEAPPSNTCNVQRAVAVTLAIDCCYFPDGAPHILVSTKQSCSLREKERTRIRHGRRTSDSSPIAINGRDILNRFSAKTPSFRWTVNSAYRP